MSVLFYSYLGGFLAALASINTCRENCGGILIFGAWIQGVNPMMNK